MKAIMEWISRNHVRLYTWVIGGFGAVLLELGPEAPRWMTLAFLFITAGAGQLQARQATPLVDPKDDQGRQLVPWSPGIETKAEDQGF